MIAKLRKNKKSGRFGNIFFSTLLVFLLVIVLVFLAITNIKIGERRNALSQKIEGLKKEIRDLEEKNNKLKENISQSGTPEYLEKIAREQFNLKASGEEVIVISKEKTEEQNQDEANTQNNKGFLGSIKNWWNWLKTRD